jgi:hypothetical protein
MAAGQKRAGENWPVKEKCPSGAILLFALVICPKTADATHSKYPATTAIRIFMAKSS